MFLPSTNSYVKTLTPNVMILGCEAFGRELGHKGRAHVNGISDLIKRNTER